MNELAATMSAAFEHLLTPPRIRDRTVPGQAVFASYQTDIARHNRFEERHAEPWRRAGRQ